MLSNCAVGEDCCEIKSVNPEGIQPQICIRRTDAEARMLWPPDMKEQPPHLKRP